MKTMKKLIPILFALTIMTGVLAGCSDQTSDDVQQTQQEKILDEGTKQTGMPNITNFRERKLAKDILEKRDDANLITYVYTRSEMSGKWVYQGKAMGYPLPYSTEYTNPEKIADSTSQGGYAILPQADPNALFSSQSTAADWLMMINPKTNQPEIVYAEPDMYVTPSKIRKELVEPWSIEGMDY